jgi:hypothetical protein
MLTPLGLRFGSPCRGMLPGGSGRKALPEAQSFEKWSLYTSLAYLRKKLALDLFRAFRFAQRRPLSLPHSEAVRGGSRAAKFSAEHASNFYRA